MSDSPKPLSDTLEHPLQSRLLSAVTSSAALIDRAQLGERLLVERARLLRPSLPLRQLRTVDERRRRRRSAKQP